MAHVKAVATIDKPVAEVFAYVDDYKTATEYTQDLTKWEPVGEKNHGLGSIFAAAMKMGPTTQESTLEITDWVENASIKWEPRAGFQQAGGYTFAADGDRTTVTFELEITFPGGLAGKMLGKTIEPIAKLNLQKSLERLKKILETV